MIRFSHKGDFSKVTRFLERAKEVVHLGDLDKYGREGVAALASATPVDSGLTASSWYYEIVNRNGSAKITFYNSNIQNGVPIAIILQYGHGTRNGGWVQGRDYINPVTATCLIEDKQARGHKETVTSELIYYWMISYNIPVEFQKWHLNRLLTLIRVCNVKNSPPKRRSKREMWNRNAAINAANRKRFGSKG